MLKSIRRGEYILPGTSDVIFEVSIASGFRHSLIGFPKAIAELIRSCCHYDPDARPSPNQIVVALSNMQKLEKGWIQQRYEGDSGWNYELVAEVMQRRNSNYHPVRNIENSHFNFLARLASPNLETTELLSEESVDDVLDGQLPQEGRLVPHNTNFY